MIPALAGICQLLWIGIRRLHPEYDTLLQGDTYNSHWYLLAFVMLVIGLFGFMSIGNTKMDPSDGIGIWSNGVLAAIPCCCQYSVAGGELSVLLAVGTPTAGLRHSVLATYSEHLIPHVFGTHAARDCPGHLDVSAIHQSIIYRIDTATGWCGDGCAGDVARLAGAAY